MVDTQHLETLIKESGKKKSYLADKCNITRQSLTSKIHNRSEFTVFQMNTLCGELGITDLGEKDRIFCAR
jgi:hypothetical protein